MSSTLLCNILEVIGALKKNHSAVEWRLALQDSINRLEESYASRGLNTGLSNSINYDSIDNCCAYIYLYLTSHAYVLKNLWQQFTNVNWFTSRFGPGQLQFPNNFNVIRVCCVGGGPGTDLVGLWLYLQNLPLHLRIEATVLDRWPGWCNVFRPLAWKLDPFDDFGLNRTNFVPFDFFQPLSDDCIRAIATADIVTVVKFVSAVGSTKKSCVDNLEYMFRFIKPSAIVLYMDNGGGGCHTDLFKIAARRAGLVKHDEVSTRFDVPESEIDMMLFSGLTFNREPQRTARISAGLWSRPQINRPPSLPSLINYSYYSIKPPLNDENSQHTFGSPDSGYQSPPSLLGFAPNGNSAQALPNSPVIFPPIGGSGNRSPVTFTPDMLDNQTRSVFNRLAFSCKRSLKFLKRTIGRKRRAPDNEMSRSKYPRYL